VSCPGASEIRQLLSDQMGSAVSMIAAYPFCGRMTSGNRSTGYGVVFLTVTVPWTVSPHAGYRRSNANLTDGRYSSSVAAEIESSL